MNEDPKIQRWREVTWRRPLTAAEADELRQWLAQHPAATADFAGEAELSRLLDRLPEAPVSSNFTARVLQQIERETAMPAPRTPPGAAWWWRVFAPRAALATVLALTGLMAYQVAQTQRSARMAEQLAVVASVHAVLPPRTQQDFDVLNFRVVGPPADEELLALLQ